MTAIVVSFPRERIFRTRQDQIEMRRSFQTCRRLYPKKTPSEWWELAELGVQLREIFSDLPKSSELPKPPPQSMVDQDLSKRMVAVITGDQPPKGAA